MRKGKLNFVVVLSGLICTGATFAGGMGEVSTSNPWTGFYAGINGGYSWSDANTQVVALPVLAQLPIGARSIQPATLSNSMSGGVLGGQIGYNWQLDLFPQFVIGIEADINWNPLSGSAHGNAIGNAAWNYLVLNNILSSKQTINWFGTVRPRIGYLPINSLLIYATGGFAYGGMKETANSNLVSGGYGFNQYPYSNSYVETGWTAGGGLEWAPKQDWSVKIEYIYYDLGSTSGTANSIPPNPPFQTHFTWTNPPQLVRAGINYHFNL